MKSRSQRILSAGAAAALALLAAYPALADDTELMLLNPDPELAPTPNVMFILDTSGSMTSVEDTIEPYDSTQTYTAGGCDPDRLYWSDVSVPPECGGGTQQFVEKTAFHCDAATRQLEGIGSYTNTMVQYRPDDEGEVSSWQDLEAGNSTDVVECRADSGEHGDGTAGEVYASALAGEEPWTANESEEISWGSSPRNVSYTVYDGNYLNWKATPVDTTMTRNQIMREVTTRVLNSVDNLNVGIMRFNDEDGGAVIQGITDLEQNRAQILDVVDGLTADGFTPLSETLYESALYWKGLAAYYGEEIDEHATDPGALASAEPEVYQQPALDVCAKNYNVLLSDGEPTEDVESQGLVPALPGYGQLLGRTACTDTGDGGCLVDVSEYLFETDLDTEAEGRQNVTTHTIGFTVDLPILRDTALASDGEYFMADDVESLTLALLKIVANISDRAVSFAAPAVSVNTFNRTQNLNQLYLTVFSARTRVHWPGNLKRYEVADGTIVDADGEAAVNPETGFFFEGSRSFWTADEDGNDVTRGGAANQLPDPELRNLYTNNGVPNPKLDLTLNSNELTPSNADSFTDADFGLTGAADEPTREELIRWARGEDLLDEDNNPDTQIRYAMGDPLHSQPAAVVYGGDEEDPDVVVFTATNDGYLHAIDGGDGSELWSFIPKELLPNLSRLYFDPSSNYKNYGIDGDVVPVVRDANNNGIVDQDGEDFVYLIFGLRRGGSGYYALDVTDKNAPELLWHTDLPTFGQSWSTPVVTRMNIDDNTLNENNAVVVIGGGYDAVHDTAAHPSTADGSGAGVHILDLETGDELWRAGRDAGAELTIDLPDRKMNRAIASRIRVLDMSGDGFADRMYAADMGGQVWRFDIANGSIPDELVAGGIIARLGAEGLADPAPADTRRFYNSPDISMFNDENQEGRFLAVSIGSGYRAHPFDQSATDRFFSIRDPDVFRQLTQTEYDNYNIVTDGDLEEVSGAVGVELGIGDRGWKFTLPDDQKVLSDSVTFNNQIMFIGFSPESNAAVATCTPGQGTNFLYTMSVFNGDPIVTNLDDVLPEEADDARREVLAQSGIAPSPTVLFPGSDPDCEGPACSPPPLACVGVECFSPPFNNNPVRTLWTQDGVN